MPLRTLAPLRAAALALPLTLALSGIAQAGLNEGLAAMQRHDYTTALRELLPAAQSGNVQAQYSLGVLHANGDGVPQDFIQAAKWFKAAAAKGHADARRDLSFLRQAGLLRPNGAGQQAGGAGSGSGESYIQVATVMKEAEAAQEWRRVQRKHHEQLGALQPIVRQNTNSAGEIYFRVLAGPFELADARGVCTVLREANSTCVVFNQKLDSLPSGPAKGEAKPVAAKPAAETSPPAEGATGN